MLSALLMLIAVAVGARVIYDLLAPLLPSLIAIAIVAVICTSLLRRR